MIQPKIQEVFIRIEDDTEESIPIEKMFNGYFFTPEEFEQFKREFGSALLEKAAENAKLEWVTIPKSDEVEVNKESIIFVLDDYLLNNKI